MAINPKIKQKAEDIRNKIYGKEVRESLASGLEAMSSDVVENEGRQSVVESRQDSVESQWQSVVDETTNLDVVSAPEIIAARDGEANLKARLDKEHQEVTTDLHQTKNLKSWELNSKDREERGIVVFISDDARQADWDVLRPIFNAQNAPFCLSTPANNIGIGLGLSLDKLLQLQSEGHEIISHSLDHDESNPIPLMSYADAEKQYRDSKKKLNDLGLVVNNYAVPFGNYRQRERLLSKKHYRASRTSDYGKQSGLNLSPIASHELNTIWLDETWGKTNFEYFQGHIDLAVEKNALLIISTHAQQVSQAATKTVLTRVIQYAQEKSRVMTLNNALDIVGNVVEIGDYTYNIDNREAKKGGHFVIGANGAISQLNRDGRFNLATPFADFPFGENSYNLFSGALGAMSPTGGGGTLTNYKSHINIYAPIQAFNYQTFKAYNSGVTYIRHLQSSLEFDAWKPFLNRPRYAVYDYKSTYTIEPKSVTTLVVTEHTFSQTALISVNPLYGVGTGVIYSTHIDGNGNLQIQLYNTRDTAVTYATDWKIVVGAL